MADSARGEDHELYPYGTTSPCTPLPDSARCEDHEAAGWRSMLDRIRVHGASGLWSGEDCAIGAVAALEGSDAARAFMLEREAAPSPVDDTVRLREVTDWLRHIDRLDDIPGADRGLPEQNILWDAANAIEARFSVDAGKPEADDER